VRVRLLSRASALARLQAALVERALRTAHPHLDVQTLTRTSAGDQDQTSPLWKLPDKGAFTADISRALVDGDADIAVHSFKDLPTEMPAGTRIAGALPRADARDVLVMRQAAITARPEVLRILSSSPRRGWLLGESLPALLPWPVRVVDAVPVRGNIETRLTKLVQGEEHGLVVAKAALDRLLGFGAPFDHEAALVRNRLERCRWMVLPMREFPWAPAQGALALEIPDRRADLDDLLKPILCASTTASVHYERQVLNEHGGGCHQALGAAAIEKPYGRVVSIRSRDRGTSTWTLEGGRQAFPRAAADAVWPRRNEGVAPVRTSMAVAQPGGDAFRVSRAEALPETWLLPEDAIVWAAGSATWRRLARRGVWINGCADGLGDDENPAVDLLAGRTVTWLSLTHDRASRPEAVATYHVEVPLPDDLASRSHFYWTSGEMFRRAIDRWPSIKDGWHGSGPGRTRHAIEATIGATGRTGIWLDRESWERDVCR
jgi:hydroxymethylbilane synthase